MKRASFLATIGTMALLATAPAFAQTGPNGTSSTAKVATDNNTTSKVTADHQLRSSKLVGASVSDDNNNTIGTIDDLIISPNGKTTGAVLSVGGFLGMGSKLVDVPFSQLKINKNGDVVLPGATKANLKAKPDYHYNNG